jgi:hypothetical protein
MLMTSGWDKERHEIALYIALSGCPESPPVGHPSEHNCISCCFSRFALEHPASMHLWRPFRPCEMSMVHWWRKRKRRGGEEGGVAGAEAPGKGGEER